MGNIFPRILRHAGIPKELGAVTPENDAATLGQIFADKPEGDFLAAVAVLEQFKVDIGKAITKETAIGELRAATRKRIVDDNATLVSQLFKGIPVAMARRFIEAPSLPA